MPYYTIEYGIIKKSIYADLRQKYLGGKRMIGSGLKKYGRELGLNITPKNAYGEVGGYLVSLFEGAGYKSFYINCALASQDDLGSRYKIDAFVKDNKKEYNITSFDINEHGFTVMLYDTFGTLKKYKRFFLECLNFLKEIELLGADVCCNCKTKLDGENSRLIVDNGIMKKYDVDCVNARLNEIEELKNAPKESKNYAVGILGAFLGMLVGIVPWIIVYCFGFFVGWLGFLIGFCAQKGYELVGAKVGKLKVYIIIAMSLVGVVLAQFLGYCASVGIEFIKMGISFDILPLIAFVYDFVVYDPQTRANFVGELFMGFVFAILGLIGLIRSLSRDAKSADKKFEVIG